ncbi:MAG: hypothetical protein R2712_02635 [Vicinamibacterales bacterium]
MATIVVLRAASNPTAVFWAPVLCSSADTPTAVLPVLVFTLNAPGPTATDDTPLARCP